MISTAKKPLFTSYLAINNGLANVTKGFGVWASPAAYKLLVHNIYAYSFVYITTHICICTHPSTHTHMHIDTDGHAHTHTNAVASFSYLWL